jgi:lysozyme family protein
MLFDFAVNAGPGRSAKLLQHVLGMPEDGLIGPVTLQNIEIADKLDLISRFSSAKINHYEELPTFPIFGKGWLARVEKVKSRACAMLG